jgi:hypothetical protein
MSQFYFHTRAGDVFVEDHSGHSFQRTDDACAYAIQRMPALLRKSLEAANTHVSTQICDENQRTIAVIRGTVIIEIR